MGIISGRSTTVRGTMVPLLPRLGPFSFSLSSLWAWRWLLRTRWLRHRCLKVVAIRHSKASLRHRPQMRIRLSLSHWRCSKSAPMRAIRQESNRKRPRGMEPPSYAEYPQARQTSSTARSRNDGTTAPTIATTTTLLTVRANKVGS